MCVCVRQFSQLIGTIVAAGPFLMLQSVSGLLVLRGWDGSGGWMVLQAGSLSGLFGPAQLRPDLMTTRRHW